jgi:hypothetical protein
VKITSQNPSPLVLNQPTGIVLGGIGFDNRTLKIKIEGDEIKSPVIQSNSIAFQYTAKKDKPRLIIYDEKDVEIVKYDLITAPAETDEDQPEETDEDQPASTVTVTGIAPDKLVIGQQIEITITGTGLDAVSVIKVSDEVIEEITKTDTSIKFNYTATTTDSAVVVGLGDKEKELFNKSIPVS